MTALRFIICAGLVAFGAPLRLPAEQKPAATYPDTDAAAHAGEDATVTGKVIAISKSAKGTLYLNFGDRFPRPSFAGAGSITNRKFGETSAPLRTKASASLETERR